MLNTMNIIFSDEKKRQVYDEYGSFGLYISEQAGEECVPVIMCLQSGWFKVSQVKLVRRPFYKTLAKIRFIFWARWYIEQFFY